MHEEKGDSKKQKEVRKRSTDSLTSAGYELFEILRRLRLVIAREEALPPYVVFNDKTLVDMCVKVPQNREDMLNVSGVGNTKFEKYGKRFLDEIKEYQLNHPDVLTSMLKEAEVTTVTKKKKRKS